MEGRYSDELQRLSSGLPNEGAERLERSLDRTKHGFSTDLRSPFYEAAPREEIGERLRTQIGVTGIAVLDSQDEEEAEKWGPYSIMKPSDERLPSLLEYGSSDFNPDEGALKRAFERLLQDVPPHSIRPWSLDNAYRVVYRDSENLGLPWLTKDKKFLRYYLEDAKRLKSPEEFYPFVWYWRGQPQGLHSDPKQRDVWGAPHTETILGQTIFKPWLEVVRRLDGYSAWVGDWKVDDAMTRILKRAQDRPIVSMDQKGFDKRLSYQLLMLARDYFAHCLTPDVTERILLLAEYGATGPIVVPFDVIHRQRKGGMPSGKTGTNAEDTVLNRVACLYVAYRAGTDVEDGEWLGDDSVVLFRDPVSTEDISCYMKELGLECNTAKQFVSNRSVHYLQRIHTLDYTVQGRCVGVRSPFRCLNGMMSYERMRPKWNKYMDTARWIMQVENAKHDPRFHELVAFLRKGDKVLASGMDPVSVFKRAGGADVIRSTLGIASFPFNTQDPSRISEFQTTEILRSMN
jgi:hypothetical protein